MTQQIFGAGGGNVARMVGFAANDAARTGAGPKNVMHFYTVDQAPVISIFAKSFSVSDRWHASAPNQTWLNRLFARCATANGYVNNSPIHPPYLMPTAFNRLTDKHRSWRIYFRDIPQSLTTPVGNFGTLSVVEL